MELAQKTLLNSENNQVTLSSVAKTVQENVNTLEDCDQLVKFLPPMQKVVLLAFCVTVANVNR